MAGSNLISKADAAMQRAVDEQLRLIQDAESLWKFADTIETRMSSLAHVDALQAAVINAADLQVSGLALHTRLAEWASIQQHHERIAAAHALASGAEADFWTNIHRLYDNLYSDDAVPIIDGIRRITAFNTMEQWAELAVSARDRDALLTDLRGLLATSWSLDPDEAPTIEDVAAMGRAIKLIVSRRVRVRTRFRHRRASRVATFVHDQIHGHYLRTGVPPPDAVASETIASTNIGRTADGALRRPEARTDPFDTHLCQSAASGLVSRLPHHPPAYRQPHLGRCSRVHPRRPTGGRPLRGASPRAMGIDLRMDGRSGRPRSRSGTALAGKYT